MDKFRIVIEMSGNYQSEMLTNILDMVRQVCIRRDPLDEPFISTEVSKDDGKSWNEIII